MYCDIIDAEEAIEDIGAELIELEDVKVLKQWLKDYSANQARDDEMFESDFIDCDDLMR